MKQILQNFLGSLAVWFRSLKSWQSTLLIIILVAICIFWLLVLSNVGEWWHWEEWQQHIKNEHK